MRRSFASPLGIMSLLSRARPAHLSIHPHTSASVQTIRYRSAIPARKHFERIESRGRDQSQNRSRNSGAPKRPAWKPAPLKLVIHPPPTLDLAIIPTTLASLSKNWVKLSHVRQRLIRFGIPLKHVAPLLSAFSSALHNGTVLSSLDYEEDYLTRLSRDLGEVTNNAQRTDITLSRLFFEWAASSTGEQALLATNAVPPETISMIQTLFKAADLSNPSAFYPLTRAWPKRKVIMHVGPTNSGKTHNALRALAAAKTGVYAGPLRLLAHEIWERLNKGQIVPLGMDPEEDAEPDLENNIDGGTPFDINTPNPSHSKPIIQKTGNSKFARVCNLVTGEEQKILDELCGLYSCTIEMISFSSMVDVAVIDEIQMISDSERGGSWTSALLGLNAKEVHVCGEESAVPLVQSILKDTGDEIIVHRHERLSPLSLQETSLGGELSNVRKGDCVVAFSRSEIFKAKSVIEQKTGLKCAVAYGRLPPEIRSEQARLFNDPDSGFDIIVGSDAIGMGLNL